MAVHVHHASMPAPGDSPLHGLCTCSTWQIHTRTHTARLSLTAMPAPRRACAMAATSCSLRRALRCGSWSSGSLMTCWSRWADREAHQLAARQAAAGCWADGHRMHGSGGQCSSSLQGLLQLFAGLAAAPCRRGVRDQLLVGYVSQACWLRVTGMSRQEQLATAPSTCRQCQRQQGSSRMGSRTSALAVAAAGAQPPAWRLLGAGCTLAIL
jgi:hypothetical protein